MLQSPTLNGSPRDRDEESHSCSVSPRNSRYVKSTPAATTSALDRPISDRDISPHYLCSSSPQQNSTPSPSISPSRVSHSSHPPEMAFRLAYHLEPERSRQYEDVASCHRPHEASRPAAVSPRAPVQRSTSAGAPASLLPVEDCRTISSLSEISRLLRLQKYHKSRSRQAEDRLRRLQVATAKTNRLTCAARLIQHTLAECIKSEDKDSFGNLLHAFHDATDDVSHSAMDSDVLKAPQTPFLEHLSPSSRSITLDFMSKVRHDGSFVADQLENLSQKELVALLPDGSSSRLNDSVFGSSLRTGSRTSRPLGFMVDAQVDLLASFSYCSALEALIFGPQNLSMPVLSSDTRATDVWSTVCARLISKQRPGSEKFVPAVLDVWASSVPWPGKDRLEVWILETLNRGAFLLDLPGRLTFKARSEGRPDAPAEDDTRMEAFYSQAVSELLDLLSDGTGGSLIPPGALTISRAIAEKLARSPSHQRGLPQFLVTRWLSSSFLMDAVTLPEAHDLLTDHYIYEVARQRILREIVMRVQKAVYEVAYPWKHGSNPSPDMTRRVGAVMTLFQPRIHPGSLSDSRPGPDYAREDTSETFIAISAKDVLISLNALYPQRRPSSLVSDFESSKSGLQSSASSISGFSLFRHAKSSESFSSVPSLCSSESQPAPETPSEGVSTMSADMLSIKDNVHVQEARIELEDALANGSGSAWEFLELDSSSKQIYAPRERSSQADGNRPSVASSSLELSREQVVVKKAIKQLLSSFDASNITNTADATESLSVIRNQLETIFLHTARNCEARSDYFGAHSYHQQLQELRQLTSRAMDMNCLRKILESIECRARESVERSLALERICELRSQVMTPFTQLQTAHLTPMIDIATQLRDKMWYVAHVRTSSAYDEARSIASALRIMGKTKKSSPRPRLTPPLRHWPASKSSTATFHLKSEAQVLELLSAKTEHCGPNKLSDEQSRLTAAWIKAQNIDNLCRGEERLHRLCMEVRKCVESITNPAAENSMIHANTLFARDMELTRAVAPPSSLSGKKQFPLSNVYIGNARPGMLTLQTRLRSVEGLSNAAKALSSTSSRDYLDTRSPTLTNQSSIPFWSPAISEVDSPSSATSIGSAKTQAALNSSVQQHVAGHAMNDAPTAIERLRQRLTGLVLSDLTANSFSKGSETDNAFWTGLGWKLLEKHFRNVHDAEHPQREQEKTEGSTDPPPFDFENAFRRFLQKFAATSNPTTKLSCLYDIDRLLKPYMIQLDPSHGSFAHNHTSESIRAFRHLFTHPALLPLLSTVFRDLQYIASLIPSMNSSSPRGQSFHNAALALSSLRTSARTLLVETADQIIAYHSNNRPGSSSIPHPPSPAQAQRDDAIFAPATINSSSEQIDKLEDVSSYTLADAAQLLQIAAKDGCPVAQRELATLYLTDPEGITKILAPFARAREVFKEERNFQDKDKEKCDPAAMCVAIHWMGLSAEGGDVVAREVLRQGEEWVGLSG